jgi:endonuclease-3
MPRVRKEDLRRRAVEISAQLGRLYPEAQCSLDHKTPLQLLIATILSAQCTDARVNKVTPSLFRKYRSAADFASAEIGELETAIQSTGFFRNKAKNIKACCQILVDRHHGQPPRTLEELIELPGVARKTANVVLGNAFGVPGLPVDTHVGRLSRRMGLSKHTDPVKVETDLTALLPPEEWAVFSHRLIFHGREVCTARKPFCDRCAVANLCPKVGVLGLG